MTVYIKIYNVSLKFVSVVHDCDKWIYSVLSGFDGVRLRLDGSFT